MAFICTMFDVNNYFEGKVASLAFSNQNGNFTSGVMADGEYEFGTAKAEVMTVIEGTLTVQLPDSTEWETFGPGTKFDVPANSNFKVKAEGNTAYLCQYLEA